MFLAHVFLTQNMRFWTSYHTVILFTVAINELLCVKKSRNGTFLALQTKVFEPKRFKFHGGVKKSAILAFFAECNFKGFVVNTL